VEELSNLLYQEISVLRSGYGFQSNIKDALNLTELLGLVDSPGLSPDHMASRMLEIVNTLMPGPEMEVLLAALNLLDGYGHISSPENRRTQYYIDCFPGTTPKDVKGDTIYKRENKTIMALAEKIAKASEEKKLDAILKRASRRLMLNKPLYTKKGADEQMALEMALTVDAIAGEIEVLPQIAGGVSEANTKLDELLKLAPKIDNFDQYVDNQTNANMTVFIYNLLGDKIDTINPVQFDLMVQELRKLIDDALNRAILMRLPDNVFNEIEKYSDTNPDDLRGLAELILQKAKECGLDLTAIIIDTLTRIERLYRSGVKDAQEVYYQEYQEAEYQPAPESVPRELPEIDANNMSDDELREWQKEVLGF
jgi:hypothetical protein